MADAARSPPHHAAAVARRIGHRAPCAVERVAGVLRVLGRRARPYLRQAARERRRPLCRQLGVSVSDTRTHRPDLGPPRTSPRSSRAERFTLTADISLVGFALLVFAPDPSWRVYSSGFLVIAKGGLPASQPAPSRGRVAVAHVRPRQIFRATLGITSSVARPDWILAAISSPARYGTPYCRSWNTMRQRESDLYSRFPGQEDDGEALASLKRRPVHWNKPSKS